MTVIRGSMKVVLCVAKADLADLVELLPSNIQLRKMTYWRYTLPVKMGISKSLFPVVG